MLPTSRAASLHHNPPLEVLAETLWAQQHKNLTLMENDYKGLEVKSHSTLTSMVQQL